jgi:ATP-binding cassette subfamily C protein CydD
LETEGAIWLKQLQSRYRYSLVKLLMVKLGYFIGQIACFWYFSSLMHNLIVEHEGLKDETLLSFVMCSVVWIVLRHISESHLSKLNANVELMLQHQINSALDTQQHALARRYSSFFWQQVYLKHIPSIAQYVSQYTSQKYISVIFPLFVILIIIPINWFVALILMISLPIVPIFMILVGHGAAELHRKHFISLERLGGLFVDRLKALTLLTSFNQHDVESKRLSKASQLVNRQTMRVVSLAFLSSSVLDFFATVSMALVAVYIGFSLLGELSIGPDISFHYGLYLLLVTPLLFAELKTLGRLYHQKSEAEAAVDAIFPIINSVVESPLFKGDSIKGNSFSDIGWIDFKTSKPSIYADKLDLNNNDSVFLTGNSGAGKSVLLDALMGLRKSTHSLSGQVVLISQKPTILPTSVRDNLLMGQDIPDSELWLMLEQVQLLDKVKSLPLGLDSLMGENPMLSGGEAQRLNLARALLQPFDILLLDEPTAHLTELQHNQLALLIHELTQSKTRIWASHKSLPLSWFNRNWLIKDGLLVQTDVQAEAQGKQPC